MCILHFPQWLAMAGLYIKRGNVSEQNEPLQEAIKKVSSVMFMRMLESSLGLFVSRRKEGSVPTRGSRSWLRGFSWIPPPDQSWLAPSSFGPEEFRWPVPSRLDCQELSHLAIFSERSQLWDPREVLMRPRLLVAFCIHWLASPSLSF